MRRPAEYFDEVEVTLIHIAGTLRGALKLERLLDEHGVEYAVEADQYLGGFLFPRSRAGAFFYVAARDGDATRELLSRHRFKVHRDSP